MLRDVLEHSLSSSWPMVSLIIFVLCFAGILWWTFSGRRDRFNHDSRLPLEDSLSAQNNGESKRE